MKKIDTDIPKVRVIDLSRTLTIESIEIQHKVRIDSYCGGVVLGERGAVSN